VGHDKRGALAALGLDAMLDENGNETRSFDSEPSERELLLAMHETLQNILRQKAGSRPESDPRGPGHEGGTVGTSGDRRRARDGFDLPAGSSSLAEKVETVPQQNLGDDEDDPYREFSDYLDCGLSRDEAAEAAARYRAAGGVGSETSDRAALVSISSALMASRRA
jgi:hypothetical protein